MRLKCLNFLAAFIVTICTLPAFAQNLSRSGKWTSDLAIKRAIAQVQAKPNNLEAHQNFIQVSSLSPSQIEKQYKIWVKKYPKSDVVFFSIGDYYHRQMQDLLSQGFLSVAAKLNPKSAKYWYLMSLNAYVYDLNWARNYASKSVNLAPDNPDYLYNYAMTFHNVDSVAYDSLMRKVGTKFPHTEQSRLALYRLINNTNDLSKKDSLYKEILSDPPKKLSDNFNSRVYDYYVFLLKKDVALANTFLREIAYDKKNITFLDTWRKRLLLTSQIVGAETLMNRNPDSAVVILDSIKIDNYSPLYLAVLQLKAKAQHLAGHTLKAYNMLIQEYSIQPNSILINPIKTYANALGFSEKDIVNNIFNLRDSSAILADNFTLRTSEGNGSRSLTDYRGNATLLTYWFPFCFPCREEFPHFEKVLKSLTPIKPAYIAINVQPLQKKEAISLIKMNNYSFISLEDTWERKKVICLQTEFLQTIS